jgi:succinyl-CoA synthetase alpha subunit
LKPREVQSRLQERNNMAIFVNEKTKVLVQGLTGGQGRFHGLRNRDYGTQVVAGVTPGKAGQDVEGIPVFDTVETAVATTGATASFIAVPPKAAPAAILEAARAGIGFVVCITEGVPAQDEARVFATLQRDFPKTRLLGPNCPGIISPGKCNIGITAGEIAALPTAKGPNVGIVSRSGTLTYQALYELKQRNIGVSTCVGIGGDPVPGTSFVDCLAEFQSDPETHAIIMIGEIGGTAEEEAAEFIMTHVTKPMSAYIAGVTAPAGKKMGHAGAIVSGGKGTAQGKMDALKSAGVKVGLNPTEACELMAQIIASM